MIFQEQRAITPGEILKFVQNYSWIDKKYYRVEASTCLLMLISTVTFFSEVNSAVGSVGFSGLLSI